jgi:hypothetical protein
MMLESHDKRVEEQISAQDFERQLKKLVQSVASIKGDQDCGHWDCEEDDSDNMDELSTT